MTALIGALRVSLSADTAKFEDGMRRAQRQANASATSIGKSMGLLKAGVAGFVGGLSVGLLSRVIGDALEYAGSLGEVSQQLGVTTRDLQVFRFAAGQVGVSQEQLETGLSKLTITMGKVAAGAKAPAAALNAIGISADQIKGKDTGEVFRLIADGLQKVTDRSQRAAVEVALFGKSGAMLDNMLSGGSSQINALAAAADELGIVLSDEQIQNADDTADKLEAVKTVLAAQIAGVVSKNANAILGLASALGTLTGQILNFLNSNPQLALAIIGGLLGGRVGGLPGAAVGAIGGAFLGQRMAEGAADGNTDLRFRMEQTRQAKAAYLNAQKGAKRLGTDREVKRTEAELRKQTSLLVSATKSATSSKATIPTGADIGQFLAPAGPKAKAPKKAKEDHTAEDQLRDAKQFNDDLRRAQMDVLQARRDLAHTADEQASLDLQLLDLQKQDQDAELAYQVQLYKLTDGKQGLSEEQAKQLQAQHDTTDALKRRAISENSAAQKARDAAELRDNAYSLQIELLQHEANMARTAKDRRAAELRILDVMKQQERARLEAVIADKQSSELAKKEAQQRLGQLDNIYAGRAEETKQQTMGPLESYLDSLPDTANEVNEALEGIAANGLQSLNDGLVDAIMNSKSLGDMFHNVAQQILADLLRLAMQQATMALFSAFTGGASGSPSVAGGMDFSSFGSALLNVPKFATGGSFDVIGRGGTDKNLLSLNGLPIARVSHGERINIANDDHGGGMAPMSLSFHNDFRGADPSAVAAIRARQDQFEAELPGRVVQAYADARSRHVIRG